VISSGSLSASVSNIAASLLELKMTGGEGGINYPLAALAHLGLGRSYALAGDSAKAKAAYQDFFTLGKMPIRISPS